MSKSAEHIPEAELWNPILDELEYIRSKGGISRIALVVVGASEVFVQFECFDGEIDRYDIEPGAVGELWRHACDILSGRAGFPPLDPISKSDLHLLEPARLVLEENRKQWEKEQDRISREHRVNAAQGESDFMFRARKYSSVVAVLGPLEGALDQVHSWKLQYARKKIAESK